MIRFVYFDVAGTMIAPHPSVGDVYAAAGQPHGLHVAPADLDAAFRRAWHEWTKPDRGGPMSAVADADATWRWWRGLVFAVLDDVGFDRPRESVFEACYNAFATADAWRVYPDVRPTLDEFSARGMRLGVLSNWDHRLPPLLERLDLAKYFEIQIVSALEGVEKPDPRIFTRALKRAGVAVDETLYVGDHVHLDLDPARALGIHAYLIDRHQRSTSPWAIDTLTRLVPLTTSSTS